METEKIQNLKQSCQSINMCSLIVISHCANVNPRWSLVEATHTITPSKNTPLKKLPGKTVASISGFDQKSQRPNKCFFFDLSEKRRLFKKRNKKNPGKGGSSSWENVVVFGHCTVVSGTVYLQRGSELRPSLYFTAVTSSGNTQVLKTSNMFLRFSEYVGIFES